jgi:hypothetical protein
VGAPPQMMQLMRDRLSAAGRLLSREQRAVYARRAEGVNGFLLSV